MCLGSNRDTATPPALQGRYPICPHHRQRMCLRPPHPADRSKFPLHTGYSCLAMRLQEWHSKCPWGKHCNWPRTRQHANHSMSQQGRPSKRRKRSRQRSPTKFPASTPRMLYCSSILPHCPSDRPGNFGKHSRSEHLLARSTCPVDTAGKCSHQALHGHCSTSLLGNACMSATPRRSMCPHHTRRKS